MNAARVYQEKAKEIVKESIKSAIYIDEKAKDFYDYEVIESGVVEEQLSVDLFKNFKNQGISLDVHKFKTTDFDNAQLINYIFKKRDLILLDWKLGDDNSGEEYALKLLADIIKEPHIHFCSIYTTQTNFEEIINNIQVYFSGYDSTFYDNIKETFSYINFEKDKTIQNLISSINHQNPNDNGRLIPSFREIDSNFFTDLKEVTGINSHVKALVQLKFAFLNYHKSEYPNSKPSHINIENATLNINDTIITIISKTINTSQSILDKLSDQVYNSENSFSLLLGLDMQNSFSNNSSFIDPNLLNTSLDTLMYHRKQLIKEDSDIEFQGFIRSVLFEHAKLTLGNSSLKILESEFLNEITNDNHPNINELATINSFYNGSVISKSELNFGDIFIDEETNKYYLCINALCDCLHPENINNNFFFVHGAKGNLKDGINSGDSGFKSFIDKETCILWTQTEYIKPFQLHISEPKIADDKLSVSLLENNTKKDIILTYLFTLKPSYAQRIANHAFAYPVRVGVDFVKLESEESPSISETNGSSNTSSKLSKERGKA